MNNEEILTETQKSVREMIKNIAYRYNAKPTRGFRYISITYGDLHELSKDSDYLLFIELMKRMDMRFQFKLAL